MKKHGFIFLCVVLMALLVSCAPQADYDLTGTWDYTMIDTDGNTYDDGTITFSGSPTSGTYLEVNIYEVEYNGDYRVKDSEVVLTGDEVWQGSFSDADHMRGVWQHDDGFEGEWTAVRTTP